MKSRVTACATPRRISVAVSETSVVPPGAITRSGTKSVRRSASGVQKLNRMPRWSTLQSGGEFSTR